MTRCFEYLTPDSLLGRYCAARKAAGALPMDDFLNTLGREGWDISAMYDPNPRLGTPVHSNVLYFAKREIET